jgi:hypothetical protein
MCGTEPSPSDEMKDVAEEHDSCYDASEVAVMIELTEEKRLGSGNAVNGAGSKIAEIEKKFIRLRDEWKSQRGHEPSTMKAVLLPAYQRIIGIGPAAIPFLLRELESNLDNWFWALMAITEEDPVQESNRGDGQAMAAAWLKWAHERGYQW